MSKRLQKKLNIALQGGGAHGAYSWGVLDRLLEEEDIEISGISGTSAGAMNGAVLVDGYRKGGREGARHNLRLFWERVSQYASIFSPVQQTPFEQFQQGFSLDNSAAYNYFDMLSRMFSPYELNPMNINPLEQVLEDILDVAALNSCGLMPLFVTATNVHNGQPRVFHCDEITIDVLLASACIPFLFQAVEIDGEPYWDGGYVGNPSIWPLIYHAPANDVMLVQINPIAREGTPSTSVEIINRLNEITFNSSLIAEMRAIHFVSKLIQQGTLDGTKYRKMHMHVVVSDEILCLSASSKLNADMKLFEHLHMLGRADMSAWLKKHKKHIGKRDTLDFDAYLYRPTPQKRQGRR